MVVPNQTNPAISPPRFDTLSQIADTFIDWTATPTRFEAPAIFSCDGNLVLFTVRQQARYTKGKWVLSGGVCLTAVALLALSDDGQGGATLGDTKIRRLRPNWSSSSLHSAINTLYKHVLENCAISSKIKIVLDFVDKAVSDPEYHVAIKESFGNDIGETDITDLSLSQLEGVVEFFNGWVFKPVIDIRNGDHVPVNNHAYIVETSTLGYWCVWRPDVADNEDHIVPNVTKAVAEKQVAEINKELGMVPVQTIVINAEGEIGIVELYWPTPITRPCKSKISQQDVL